MEPMSYMEKVVIVVGLIILLGGLLVHHLPI